MKVRQTAAAACLIVAGLVLAAAAGEHWLHHHRWYHHHTRAPIRCGVPGYPYCEFDPAGPATAITGTALPLSVVPETATTAALRSRVFPMQQSELRKDHCAISNAAVTIRKDGYWIVNFTATQDPASLPRDERPQFERFKRNRFHVLVRGLGAYKAPEGPESILVGKPELFRLPVEAHWVRRGQTQYMRCRANENSPLVSRFFDSVDRFEIDFWYE